MIHVAAQAVVLDGRYMRQRCAWCGLVLIDLDLTNCHSVDGKPPATWAIDALIEVHENGQSLVVAEGKALPYDCCACMELDR